MTQRVAECHPDRTPKARGLCGPCYRYAYYYANLEKSRRQSRESYHRRKLLRPRKPAYLVYGLTAHDIETMEARQEGRCAVCRGALAEAKVVIDHDHATGVVRGLLCDPCNKGLGFMRDSPMTMYQAIRYLYNGQAGAEGMGPWL